MSTAKLVLNENGDPYSPRKQGAGLANLYSAINTKAYLSVDGINKTKIELKIIKNFFYFLFLISFFSSLIITT